MSIMPGDTGPSACILRVYEFVVGLPARLQGNITGGPCARPESVTVPSSGGIVRELSLRPISISEM